MIATLLLAAGIALKACPSACGQVDSLLAIGDTVTAVEVLRTEHGHRPDDPGILGRLGEVLTATAPRKATEFQQRAEAEDLLQRAIDLDGRNPRWWLARGLLERKRLNKVDAMRLLRRAAELADEATAEADDPPPLSDEELARLHAEVGRALEEHVLDFEGYIPQHPDLPVVTGGVGAGGEVCPVAFCKNFERPRSFHEVLLKYDTQDGLVADDREAMRRHFGLAFQIDPSLDLAARGWLGELARSGEWQAYVEVARRYAAASEARGWPLAFLGAGLWRMGDEEGADSAFQAALLALPSKEARLLRDVRELLRKDAAERLAERRGEGRAEFEDVFWTTRDPLLLTPVNERQVEHFTRVALAELWFGDPQLGRRGAETDRGLVFIRYGEPRWIRQIRLESGDLQALGEVTGGSAATRDAASGRWIFWTYSRDAPSFIFQKTLGARRVTFPVSSATKEYEEAARERRPSSFEIPNFTPLEYQVARFMGDSVDVDADVIVAVPEVAAVRREVPARAGFFGLPRAPGEEVVRMETPLDLALDQDHSVTFRVPVNRGTYPFAIEVVADDRSVLAASRASLEAEPFDDGLTVSDILMARSVEPAVPDPRTRRQFRIVPAADLTVRVGQPIGVYFEIYGLEEDPESGRSRYTVELRIRRPDQEGLLGGIVRRLSEILGSSESGTVTWEGGSEEARRRVPEWFTLSLPELEPGDYRVEVVVRDVVGGGEAAAARVVHVVD